LIRVHSTFVPRYSFRLFFWRVFEYQAQRLRRVNPFFELPLQSLLGFTGQAGFYCFFPSQLWQDGQFALKILR